MRTWVLLIIAMLLSTSTLSAPREAALLGGRMETLNEAAPDFHLRDTAGNPVRLSAFHGRPVILHFWATWCTSCRKELPAIDAFAHRLADSDVAFLLIAIDRDADAATIRDYAQKLGITLPVLRAAEGDVTERYWTWGVPATYLVDRDGRLAGRVLGPLDWAAGATLAAIEGFATP